MKEIKKATTLQEAFAAIAPDIPLEGDDPRYVDLSPYRGGENLIEHLMKSLTWPQESEFPKIILTGHRGCGKTTELLRLKLQLEKEDWFVLYWEAEAELNQNWAEWVDIILTHVRKLAEELKPNPQIELKEEILKSIEELVASVTVEKVERVERERELEASIGAGPQLPFLKALLGFKNLIRSGSEEVKVVRRKLERRASELIDQVNLFIGDVRRQLKESGKKGLVILVDGLEKLVLYPATEGLTTHQLLFARQSEFLKAPQCPIVYTMPISLLTEENVGQFFPCDPTVIPMVEVEYKNGESNREAIRALCQVAERRIEVGKVFKSSCILEELSQESGGHIRDFLRLIRYACLSAKESQIDEEAKEKAISMLSFRDYDPLVKDADLEKLSKVERERRLPSDPEYARLPYHLLVLEYYSQSGERWAAVHPSVRRLPKFREAYGRHEG